MNKIIGLYISNTCLDACIYVSTNEPIYKSFANNDLGHEEFIKLTKNQEIELIVYKTTGGCKDEICEKLYRNGQQIHKVNTDEFDSFSKSVNLYKTDTENAFTLANYGYKMQLTANYLYPVVSETVKKYQERKNSLVSILSNENNNLNNSIDGIEKESIEKMIKFLQKEIAHFDEKLNELIGPSQELQEKTKILETIPAIKSPQAKRSSIVDQPSTSSINQLHTKSQVIKSLEKIFCCEISTTVLVDMVIDNDNYFTAVGRPQGYYGNKQVRHVIPYSFIVNAIKSILVNQQYGGYKEYLESILDSTSSLMYKSGICLTEEQFATLPTHYQISSGQFLLRTSTKEKVTNTYHMIYNMMIINHWTNISEFTDDIKQYAEVEFQNKFKKYVQFGIKQYLDRRVDSNNEYAMTAFLEAITRMILSVSNQDIYSAFPTEGNSICTEVRLYPDTKSAFDAGDNYILCSQAMITQMIAEAHNVNIYNKCIRIVNNEGSRVQNASRALIKLNTFMDTEIFKKTHDTRQERSVKKLKMMDKEEYLQDLYNKYNNLYTATKYTALYAPTNSPDINKYYVEPLSSNNIEQFLHYHVAMHLYSIFDFKPLENNVLVPKINQPGETNSVQVYPSAKGLRTVNYVVQNGDMYRNTQCNTATGYNNPIFRSQLEDTKILDILKDKIVAYIKLALVPFAGLRNGFQNDNDVKLSGTHLIIEAFCKLIQHEYLLDGKLRLEQEYLEQIIKNNLLDLSGESSMFEQDNFEL